MFDTAQSPLTQTFGLGVFEMPTNDHFERIEEFFADRGAPIFHEISPVPNQSLLGRLHERGYYPIEFTNILYRNIDDNWSIEVNPALQVRQIKADEQEDYCKLCAEAWQLPAEFAPFFHDLGKVTAMNDFVASFGVENDAKPIGGGNICFS